MRARARCRCFLLARRLSNLSLAVEWCAVIKAETKPKLPLLELIRCILQLIDKKEFKSLVADFKAQLLSTMRSIVGKPPLLVDLEKRLGVTEVALKISTAQSARCPLYSANQLTAAHTRAFLTARRALAALHLARREAADAASTHIAAAATLADATAQAESAAAAADEPSARAMREDELVALSAAEKAAGEEAEALSSESIRLDDVAWNALRTLNLDGSPSVCAAARSASRCVELLPPSPDLIECCVVAGSRRRLRL